MSHDLQMSRSTVEGEFNLAIGEPYFLQDTLLAAARLDVSKWPVRRPTYPVLGGEQELLEQLHLLHPEYKHVVVTNGAKQALEAAFYALKTHEHRSIVCHKAPYWPSYPTLASSRGLMFNRHMSLYTRSERIAVTTAPNNPDGSEPAASGGEFDIWDAAYAQPMYGFSGIPPLHRVAVFSAAKIFGMSAMRVGWLCTNDDKIADLARYWVEISTSGVSVPSQMYVYLMLLAMRDPGQIGSMSVATVAAREYLVTNGLLFQQLMQGMIEAVDGVPVTLKGMFAWFRANDPGKFQRALAQARVKLVTGEACGATAPGWYRMSMGQTQSITREALTALRETYFRI